MSPTPATPAVVPRRPPSDNSPSSQFMPKNADIETLGFSTE
jgi:hypothetical protein